MGNNMRVFLRAARAAFPYTLPVMAGYGFLGFALGALMSGAGYPVWLTAVMSVCVYAGSGQFAAVGLLGAPFNPVGAFLLELMINARHLFYGVSLLERYRGVGKKKWYMAAGLTDETFSVIVGEKIPGGAEPGGFMLAVTALNHLYWVLATIAGAAFLQAVRLNVRGMEFVMTALFVAIFVERWAADKSHAGAVVGLAVSAVCLAAFGGASFLIPSMAGILAVLTIMRKRAEGGGRGD